MGKISISKAMISHKGTWRSRRIVLELEAPGLNRELPNVFIASQGCTPEGRVVWRAVRVAGSAVAEDGKTVPINANPDVFMIWDYCTAMAIQDTLEYWRQHSINMALNIEMRSLRLERTTGKRSIALCTATKNRLWQLRHTLVTNLVAMWPHRSWVRYYIADFGSSDNTINFIMNTCQPFIRQGMLRVFTTTPQKSWKDESESCKAHGHYWHASICKNAVHAQAVEEVLVNFDGDNLMGHDFPLHVDDQFELGYGVIHYNSQTPGTYGRIAYYRKDFEHLRGYDEDAFPMGSQDADIIERLVRLGRTKKTIKNPDLVKAIPNSTEQKISNIDPIYGNLKWEKMNIFNWEIMFRRTKEGQLRRNLHKRKIGVPLTLLHTAMEQPSRWPQRRPSINEPVQSYPLPSRPTASPLDVETWCKMAQQLPSTGDWTWRTLEAHPDGAEHDRNYHDGYMRVEGNSAEAQPSRPNKRAKK